MVSIYRRVAEKVPMDTEKVGRIVNAKYEALIAEVVQAVEALDQTMMQSGDDSPLKNVWEEFVVQIKEGESILFDAYEETIRAICSTPTQALTATEIDILWLWSEGYVECDPDVEDSISRTEKLRHVTDELYRRLCSKADDYELPHWDETKDSDEGYE
jgi:hypothetical protein